MSTEQKDLPTDDKKSVKLANDKNPPTAEGHINIGMGLKVFLPSVEAQREGFTPYSLRHKETERKDATSLLLEQFPGIYVPFKEKGVKHNGD
jgi:hypothetical protein